MTLPPWVALAIAALLLGLPSGLHNAAGEPALAPLGGTTPGGVPSAAAASTAGPAPGSSPLPSPASSPTNVLVDAPCNASGGNAEVEQAFDPIAGYLYETWIGCGGIGFSRSSDGGRSFSAAMTVPGPANSSYWDPAIALAPNGTVYIGYMVSSPGDAPVVAWSYDDGASFAGYAYVFTPGPSEFSDRDFVAVAPNGTLYVTWDYSPNASADVIGCAFGGSCYFTNGDYNIVCASSTDGGAHWTPLVPVDPEYPYGGAPAGPLLVEPNGAVDVLYEDYNVTGPSLALGVGANYFTRSTDGGRTWSPRVAVSNLTFPDTDWWINGDLVRDAAGTLYATFDGRNGSEDNAWLATSTDGGVRWSDQILNPDRDGAAHIMVEAATAEPGAAYVAWMSNNSSGYWSTFERPLGANGSLLGPVTTVSSQLGIPGYWVGDTIGISYTGAGNVAVSWSYGVLQRGVASSQVFAAVVTGSAPDPPTIGPITPGVAAATVHWTAAANGSPASAFRVEWGSESNLSANVTVPAPQANTTIGPLLAFARYFVQVVAIDAAGESAPSPAVELSLTAWTIVAGTVTPATARVNVDGAPVAVVAGAFAVNTTYSPHAVSAVAPAYGSAAAVVLPVWNGTASVALALSLLNGTVRGSVSPVTADLTWDGTPVPTFGNGAFAIAATPGSNHTLAATYPGRLPYAESLQVAANTTVWANITLAIVPGELRFTVAPANATVALANGTVTLDATGNGSTTLTPGRYAWHASAPGFVDAFGNATVVSGVTTNVSVALNRTLAPPHGGSGGLSITPGELDEGLLVALLVVGLVVVILAARRRPPPAEPPSSEPEFRVAAEPIDGPTIGPLPEAEDGPGEVR